MSYKPFKVGEVANYLLDLGDRDREPISPMKLQKLVYLAHGWHLAITQRLEGTPKPLIDEAVQAWQYGPVISSVYHEFKRFGARPIRDARFNEVVEADDGTYQLRPQTLPTDDYDADTARKVIERVWEVYRALSATQLSGLTHKKGTPWSETWEKLEFKRRGESISDEKICEHFCELMDKDKDVSR